MDLVTALLNFIEDLTIYLCLILKHEIISASCQAPDNQGFPVWL